MAEKKSYTDVLVGVLTELSELKTISSYQENHLGNIDQHLNTLNERTAKSEHKISQTADRVGIIIRCGAWLAALLGGGGGLTFIALKLFGVF